MQHIKHGLLRLAVNLQKRGIARVAENTRPYQGEATPSLTVMQSVSGRQAAVESLLNFLQTTKILKPAQEKPCKAARPLEIV